MIYHCSARRLLTHNKNHHSRGVMRWEVFSTTLSPSESISMWTFSSMGFFIEKITKTFYWEAGIAGNRLQKHRNGPKSSGNEQVIPIL